MTMTSIIIPTYNGLNQLQACVDSIRTHTITPYEIIVVDNGSEDQTTAYCRSEKITFISMPANLGFPVACNLGLQLACGDELMLLNNDVIVSRNWLSNLKQALYSSPDIGIVGPITNYASGRQQVETFYEGIPAFHKATETTNIPDPSKWRETLRLVGMCFLFKREVLDIVGLLDERFSPGHYEDDDYCFRARLLGYRLLIAGDALVHHEGSVSFKQVYIGGWQELVERNRRLFIDKWRTDPAVFM
ncbi:MAG: glycosyltransferase family 2 protein [Paenibacillus sp.]|nr:glycosyltransferase family 2 protein [Paenibacillus sp.]